MCCIVCSSENQEGQRRIDSQSKSKENWKEKYEFALFCSKMSWAMEGKICKNCCRKVEKITKAVQKFKDVFDFNKGSQSEPTLNIELENQNIQRKETLPFESPTVNTIPQFFPSFSVPSFPSFSVSSSPSFSVSSSPLNFTPILQKSGSNSLIQPIHYYLASSESESEKETAPKKKKAVLVNLFYFILLLNFLVEQNK